MPGFSLCREKKPYRVYIILPLLPGFEGDAGSRDKGTSIHYELLFIRKSLYQGPTALLPRLRCIIPRPEDYISVCGLRKYETWPDKRLVTHFKLYVLFVAQLRNISYRAAN